MRSQFRCSRDKNTPKGIVIRWLRKKDRDSAIRGEITRVYPRLWRYCVAICKSREDGGDLAQAACLRAIEKQDQFEPGTAFDKWIFTIAKRVWLNELRSQKVRRGSGLILVEDADLPDNKPSSETNIFAGEVLSEVMALPEAQRETVLLVYVEGFSYKDTAAILDIPIGTVMSRLAAARKTIASRFGEHGGVS